MKGQKDLCHSDHTSQREEPEMMKKQTNSLSSKLALIPGWIWALLVGLSLCVLHLVIYWPLSFMDDTYITLHNAQTLFRGGPDLTYPTATALTGSTSLIHTILVGLFQLVFPPLWAVWLVSACGALLYNQGVYRLARLHKRTVPQSIVMGIVSFFLISSFFHLFNGLETSLAMAAIIWILVAFVQKNYTWKLGLLLGILPALRPEGAALSGFLGLFLLYTMAAKTNDEPAEPFRVILVRWSKQLAIAALGLFSVLCLSYLFTGHWIPSTIGAKQAFFSGSCAPNGWKLTKIWMFLKSFAHSAEFWLLALPFLFISRLGVIGLLFGCSILAAYFMFLPGGLAHSLMRYAHIWVPFLIYGMLVGLSKAEQKQVWIPWVVLLLLVAQSGWQQPEQIAKVQGFRNYTSKSMKPAYEWLMKKLKPGTKILVHDAGYISFKTSFVGIDMVGLKTPSSALAHKKWTLQTCGKKRHFAIHQIALKSQARYMVVSKPWERAFVFGPSLMHFGWKVIWLNRRQNVGTMIFQIKPPTKTPQKKKNQRPKKPRGL